MILRTILHNAWIEWREQRSNLLGLWAGLLLLILVAMLSGADTYVLDPQAPILFAAIGYLAYTFAIMPRVFGGKSLAQHRGMLDRSPIGSQGTFFGKALFLSMSMGLSALLPFAVASGCTYFWAPGNFSKLLNGYGGLEYFGAPMLAMHALPMGLLAWRLPIRWSAAGVLVTAAMFAGAVRAAYLGTFNPGTRDYPIELVIAVGIALTLTPWLLCWGTFTRLSSATPGWNFLRSLGLVFVGLSPAWGVGLVSFAGNGFVVTKVNPRYGSFEIQSAFLTQDNAYIFLSGGHRFTGDAGWGANRIEPHVVRLNAHTGEPTYISEGWLLAGSAKGLLYGGEETLPHAMELFARKHSKSNGVDQFSIDFDTGAMKACELTLLARFDTTELESMGLNDRWRILDLDVGRGRLLRDVSSKEYIAAIYDPNNARLHYAKELPFSISEVAPSVRVLTEKWLVGPQEEGAHWTLFNPTTGARDPVPEISTDAEVFMVLPGDRVFAIEGSLAFVYDSKHGVRTPVQQLGPLSPRGTLFASTNRVQHKLIDGEYFLERRLQQASTTRPDGSIQRGPVVKYLARYNPEANTIRWYKWKFTRRIFGATEAGHLLFIEGGKIGDLDLTTGAITFLFPSKDKNQ